MHDYPEYITATFTDNGNPLDLNMILREIAKKMEDVGPDNIAWTSKDTMCHFTNYSKSIDVKPHKRGAPFNHNGTTRPIKETLNARHIHGTECPNCQSKSFQVIGQKLQQQEEIPPDIQPEPINITRDICQCSKCHLKFLARDNQTPLQGRFGINRNTSLS